MAKYRAYLDHNATSALRPAAREAMVSAMDSLGNPSSVHTEGRNARRLVEQARREVADLVSVDADSVTFTSGATEAAHLGLTPNVRGDGIMRPAGTLYVLETEHPCILAGGRFEQEQIVAIPVQTNGLIDMDAFDKLLEFHDPDNGRPFVAVQLVNSETGVIQPVAEIAKKTRFKGGYVLCDAVQAVGRLPVDAKALGVDFMILSSHKIGGPQGVGALINVHPILDISPAIRGGGQEKNKRAGTENVAAIAGFGAAAVAAKENASDYAEITALRDSIIHQLAPICASNGLTDNFALFGVDAPRVGNTILFGLRGLKAETALIAFDLDGVAVSSGSACSSGKVGKSHVLEAMNADTDMARGAIRVSLGWNSTKEDADKFITSFGRVAKRLSEMTKTKLSGAA
jgi:cysteine desulfurase